MLWVEHFGFARIQPKKCGVEQIGFFENAARFDIICIVFRRSHARRCQFLVGEEGNGINALA